MLVVEATVCSVWTPACTACENYGEDRCPRMEAKRASFAERLKLLQGLHGITNAELARRIGVTPAQIQKYIEGDDFPTVSRLIRICDEFRVTPNNLLGFNSENNN